MGILLSIIAKTIFIAFLPFAIIGGIIRTKSLEKINKYFYDIALSIDQMGNVVYQDIFYLLFTTKHRTLDFGNPDHTVSYVLARNYYDGQCTILGVMLARFLNWIDNNHLLKAIKYNEGSKSVSEIIIAHNLNIKNNEL